MYYKDGRDSAAAQLLLLSFNSKRIIDVPKDTVLSATYNVKLVVREHQGGKWLSVIQNTNKPAGQIFIWYNST